jgi:hypothetical protein
VRTLADPKMECAAPARPGSIRRRTGSPARGRTGLKPGGEEGTYFQNFEVTTGVEVGEPCGIEVGGKRYSARRRLPAGRILQQRHLTAPVVFAGYGITAPGYDYDDYKGWMRTTRSCWCSPTSRGDGLHQPLRGQHQYAAPELRTKAIQRP